MNKHKSIQPFHTPKQIYREAPIYTNETKVQKFLACFEGEKSQNGSSFCLHFPMKSLCQSRNVNYFSRKATIKEATSSPVKLSMQRVSVFFLPCKLLPSWKLPQRCEDIQATRNQIRAQSRVHRILFGPFIRFIKAVILSLSLLNCKFQA